MNDREESPNVDEIDNGDARLRMSWRERAAKIIAEAPRHEPTKPTKDLPPTPFAGFDSAPLGASGNSTGDAELDALIHRVADFYECPPDERRLMIETARKNPEDALRSFRLMAQNVALWVRTGRRQLH